MKPTAQIALDWAVRCFGADHVKNIPIRALRLVEEAVELAQAVDVTKEKMHELVDIVYAREHGDLVQELGGVMMTVTVLCAANGIDTDEVFAAELRRVLGIEPSKFTERNQEKIDLGMMLPDPIFAEVGEVPKRHDTIGAFAAWHPVKGFDEHHYEGAFAFADLDSELVSIVAGLNRVDPEKAWKIVPVLITTSAA